MRAERQRETEFREGDVKRGDDDDRQEIGDGRFFNGVSLR